MKKTFDKYFWLFQWIAAAIILAVGIVVGFVDGVAIVATGLALIIIALLRIVPLFKTLNDKLMKVINGVEILVNVVIGAVMIYLTINKWNNGEDVQIGKVFGILLGAILYIRSVVFFAGTSLRGEKTDLTKFFAHILFISVSVYLFVNPADDQTVAYILLGIAVICTLYMIIGGLKNYNNYRKEYAEEIETKKLKKQQKKEKNDVELPNSETKTDEVVEPTEDEEIIEPEIVDEVVDEPSKEEKEEDVPVTNENTDEVNNEEPNNDNEINYNIDDDNDENRPSIHS